MQEQVTSRVHLAQARTHLANERTLLAYWRTALAFLASGAVLIRFTTSINLIIIALASILFGVFLFIYGTIRHVRYKDEIDKIK